MEVSSKSVWSAIVLSFQILATSAVEFGDPRHEITTEPFGFSSYANTELPTESQNDNAMTIDDLPEETKSNEPQLQRQEGEPADEDSDTILIAFPDNHKNFTPSQYIGDGEYPPYIHHVNNYQQQYKNYYEQKQLYNTKPIKFEENSNKNLYLSQGVNSFLEPEGSSEKPRVTRKPFPYEFEKKKKIPDNWYETTGHGSGPDQKPNFQAEHQEKKPYYVFPVGGHREQNFYKNEWFHRDHQPPTKEDGHKNPWKKVFKYLTALVPLGLLLATLTPNVISINSTANAKTTRQRSEEHIPSEIKEEDVMKLLKEYGVVSLNESRCEDRVICELARRGHDVTADAIEKAFWHLVNQTPREMAEKAGMNDLFDAIRTGNCESFKCHGNSQSKLGKGLRERRGTDKERRSLGGTGTPPRYE